MTDIPKGCYLALEWQECENAPNNDEFAPCKYIDTMRLNIPSTDKLSSILSRIVKMDYPHCESVYENDLLCLKPYFDFKVGIDCSRYNYYVVYETEEWVKKEQEKEAQKKYDEYVDALPEPKFVFILQVFERGNKFEMAQMPIYEINVDDARNFFDVPDSQRYRSETFLDQKGYEFIMDRANCNNIKMDRYDYQPIIRLNNYHDTDDEDVIPCYIEDKRTD